MMRRITLGMTLGAAMVAAVGLVSCAHSGKSGSSESSSSGSSQKAAEAPKKAEKTKPPEGVAPPPGTLLSKVQVGMDETQVRKAIGEPTSANAYITGKQFIPYYFGPDTSRTDWKYKGQGRVIFSRNSYTGQLKVIRVDYDPHETGQ